MVPLVEITEQQWMTQLSSSTERSGVLLFTPLCGTCQAADRMLQIVQASEQAIPLYKLNINYAPQLRTLWQVKSVPCVVMTQQGEVVDTRYAMGGAGELFTWLKQPLV
jgi:thioredoxin-like negative regulator of GroEL